MSYHHKNKLIIYIAKSNPYLWTGMEWTGKFIMYAKVSILQLVKQIFVV